jgi:hypothetical protein
MVQLKRHRKDKIALGGQIVSVDKKISKLIVLLNELGCTTRNSCQGSCGGICGVSHKHRVPLACRDRIWIVFSDSRSAQKFLKLVKRDSDSDRVKDWMQGFGTRKSKAWRWKLVHDDFKQVVHVTFPSEHLSLVEERLNHETHEN